MGEVLGIDVSHYQGEIDWNFVAGCGKKFAIIKCQYERAGHPMDEYFEANYKGCGDNRIARGVYAYIARASMADPVGDAKALIAKLKGRKLEYGIWLDLEDKSLGEMGEHYIQDLVYRYTRAFQSAGYYVGLYCNRSWYLNLISKALKEDFDFWIARYPKNDTGVYMADSSLKPTSYGVAWQYSSKGHVPGIKGLVDLDVDFDGIVNLK